MNVDKNNIDNNHILELLKNLSIEECKEILCELVEKQKNKKDQNNKKNNISLIDFSKKILEKPNKKWSKYVKFIESESVNGLIWAPTQVGKTDATREFIQTCFEHDVPVIVSTDNKTDQCEQIHSRLERDLCGAEIKMLKVSNPSFMDDLKNCIKNNNHRFVIFCLDNSTQIEKLIVTMTSLSVRQSEMQMIKKIAIIHDEADQITKDNNTEIISETQAESHKKWLELVHLINTQMSYMDLKRIFVTATPENCVMLYKIESADLIRLDIPINYTGYKNIEYIEFEDDLEVKQILKKEVGRIKESENCEVILYCIDRKIIDGHERVLESLASNFNCVVNTYNGNGIKAYLRTVRSSKAFENQLKANGVQYTRDSKYFIIKNLAIRKFYTMCKRIGENCVITIGKDLISRGISYVSEDKIKPMTATTMIYKPGTSMHAVGICQTVGRITGCAMPELKRRLYAPKDVIQTYKSYNKNQELYIEKMESENKLTKEVIDEMVFEKFKRHIDRAKLELKMNMKTEYKDIPGFIDGVDIIKLKKWLHDDSLVGRMIQVLYNENSISIGYLKQKVEYKGSLDEFMHNIDNGRGVQCRNGKLWSCNNGNVNLNPLIKQYILNNKI